MILTSIRKKLKIFSILSSIIILTPTPANLNACAVSSEVEELRYMLFNPDLLHQKSWWSFFYNGKLNYLDGQTFSADDEEILTHEWASKVKTTASDEEVFNCLFGSLSDSLLQLNTFYHDLQKDPASKAYFDLALSSESVTNQVTWWDEDAEQKSKIDIELNNTIGEIKKALVNEKDSFYKKKYAFQLAKLAFYSTDNNLFNSVYNIYFKNQTKRSVLDWWAMHYKSVVLEKENKLDSANYLHALVFSHSSNKMFVSKQFFSKKNLDGILTLVQNDSEHADILLMAEVINPGRSLDGIEKIYTLAPNHKHLPLLISREINKLEDWIGSTKYANAHIATDTWQEKPLMENWESDNAYLAEFTNALTTLTSVQSTHPDFYNMSLACLNLLKGNAENASNYLNNIKSDTPEIIYQLNTLKIVLITQQKDITDDAVQEEIGQLYQSLINERAMKFESQKILYSLSSYLRYSFGNKGMTYLAGLFDNYATNKFCYSCEFNTFEYSMIRYFDMYASTADLTKLLQHYDSSNKNKLEEILFKPYSNKNYLVDVLSTKYLRLGDVQHAMTTLQSIPDNFWYSFSNANYYLDSNPFINNTELFETETMASFNKREIVERMYQLEKEAATNDSKKLENYFLLGNAWYNFTANSWFVLSYGRGSATPDEKVYTIAYTKASEYYLKALQHESNPETKAKLLYMMALLSEDEKLKEYAIAYEQLNKTDFYQQKNCLTLSDMVNN